MENYYIQGFLHLNDRGKTKLLLTDPYVITCMVVMMYKALVCQRIPSAKVTKTIFFAIFIATVIFLSIKYHYSVSFFATYLSFDSTFSSNEYFAFMVFSFSRNSINRMCLSFVFERLKMKFLIVILCK